MVCIKLPESVNTTTLPRHARRFQTRMTSFVSALLAMHGEFRRTKGASAAAKRLIASLRALGFPA
jgi:purine nucleoside phosphorylase